MHLLTEGDVRAVLDLESAMDALEAAYAADGSDDEAVTDRVLLPIGDGPESLRVLVADVPARGVFGLKAFHRIGPSVRHLVHVCDRSTGEPLVVVDANHLTVVRTAATAAVAATRCAPPSAIRLGVIGSGSEARTQVRALLGRLRPDSVTVYSPRPERRQAFVEAFEDASTDVAFQAASTPEDAVADANVLVVATNTKGAGYAFQGQWLDGRQQERVHISSIGSTLPSQWEIDPDTWRAARQVIVDSPDVLGESGDALRAQDEGALSESEVQTLRDFLRAGAVVQPTQGISLFKSIGSALQDVTVAHEAYLRARALGVGMDIGAFQQVRTL